MTERVRQIYDRKASSYDASVGRAENAMLGDFRQQFDRFPVEDGGHRFGGFHQSQPPIRSSKNVMTSLASCMLCSCGVLPT